MENEKICDDCEEPIEGPVYGWADPFAVEDDEDGRVTLCGGCNLSRRAGGFRNDRSQPDPPEASS